VSVPVGRLVVLATLPLLLALGVLQGEVRSAVTPSGTTEGLGSLVVRVSADGRPQVVRLVRPAAPRPRLAEAVPTSAPRPAARRVTRTVGVAAAVQEPKRTATATNATAVDTYPWADDSSGDHDPWGFTKRQCVSYAAYRLAESGRPLDNARQHWGSALGWDDTARRLGFPVTSKPTVGAVAHWNDGERSDYWGAGSSTANGTFAAGAMGHVAWVTKVHSDGSVQVAQYNGTSDRSFSTMRVRAPRYLLL